jgi:hypothetical protein
LRKSAVLRKKIMAKEFFLVEPSLSWNSLDLVGDS